NSFVLLCASVSLWLNFNSQANSFQLFVFGARGNQRGKRGVGIFPQRKEILISPPGSCIVPVENCTASKSELREWIKRRQRIPATMIENGFEFHRSLGAIFVFQMGVPAQVLRPEIAKDFVFARRLKQLNGLGRIAAA